MFSRLIILLFAVCSLQFAPTLAFGASVGIVKGNLWYSKSPFYAGETITLYSGIWNGESSKVTGHIVFSVNGKDVGKVPFAIGPTELSEVSTKWVATEGNSQIKAVITDAVMIVNGKQESVLVDNKETGLEKVSVTLDPVKAVEEAKKALAQAESKVNIDISGGGEDTVTIGTPLARSLASVAGGLPLSLSQPLLNGAQTFDSVASASRVSLAGERGILESKLSANAKLASAEAALDKLQNKGEQADTKSMMGGISRLKSYLTDSLASTGGLKDPWTYAKYLGIGFLLFLVSRPTWLAIILLIIVLYVIWKVIRYIKRRRRYHLD